MPDQFLAVTDQGSVRLCTCEGITTLGRGSVRVEREVAIVVHQAARSRSRGISLNSNNSLLCIPNLSLNQSIVDLQTGKQVLALPKEFYATQFSRADPYTLYGLKEEQAHFYSVSRETRHLWSLCVDAADEVCILSRPMLFLLGRSALPPREE